METLLRNNYTVHYDQPICNRGNICKNTNLTYFELNDDSTLIYQQKNSGVAKFHNDNAKNVTAINYEDFVGLLSPRFRTGRGVCDVIALTDNEEYFLLNELTDTLLKYVLPYQNNSGSQVGKRAKAKQQLLKSLEDLLNVPVISAYISKYSIKRCCFFNKKSMAPSSLKATQAFSRLNNISTQGFKMSNPEIESKGFEYYEFSGEQTFNL